MGVIPARCRAASCGTPCTTRRLKPEPEHPPVLPLPGQGEGPHGGLARYHRRSLPSPSDSKLSRSRVDRNRQKSSEVPVEREPQQTVTAGGKRGGMRVQTFTSLRHRDFVFLWLSNLCNASANWFQQFTVPWLVWDIS